MNYDNPRRLTVTFDFPRPGDTPLASLLRPVLAQLVADPHLLDTSLNSYPLPFFPGSDDAVQVRVTHAFLDPSVLERGDRPQLRHLYRQLDDVLEAEGVRYSGELFRGLGILPLNTFVKLVAREDGVLTMQAIPEEEWRVPRQDVADLVDWVFVRFGQPVDAGELPQHIVKAVRRLESALDAPAAPVDPGSSAPPVL